MRTLSELASGGHPIVEICVNLQVTYKSVEWFSISCTIAAYRVRNLSEQASRGHPIAEICVNSKVTYKSAERSSITGTHNLAQKVLISFNIVLDLFKIVLIALVDFEK